MSTASLAELELLIVTAELPGVELNHGDSQRAEGYCAATALNWLETSSLPVPIFMVVPAQNATPG